MGQSVEISGNLYMHRLFARIIVLAAIVWSWPHLRADDFPLPANHGAGADLSPPSPQEAAAGFRLPPGFRAEVFAAEPQVQNPVAFAWDGRGRLWVAEY